ncbi:MAG TPA: serine/threonine-protein kinase [Oculatellaceae cyanobacterium]
MNDLENFQIGQTVAGKYLLLSVIGRGGNGTVYRAQQIFLKTEFALKILYRNQIFDEVQMRRFQLEARAAHSLNHPNLVRVHDFGLLEGNQPYLAMDLVDGITLADHITNDGPMEVEPTVKLFEQVSLGLGFAHQQSVVHRDIKPSNIMLVNAMTIGTEGSVKILDFGIAKLTNHEGGEIQALTKTGEIFGSPLYMSPEQCGGELVDHRADIYSLGCSLFETLTGTPPHVGQNALRTMMLHQSVPPPLLREASLGRTFPDALEKIVQKMLSKNASDRYSNLYQVAHELAAIRSNGKATTASAASKKSTAKTAKTITMTVTSFYAIVVAVAIGSAALSVVLFPRANSPSMNAASDEQNNTDTVLTLSDRQRYGPVKVAQMLEQAYAKVPVITSKMTEKVLTPRSFKFPDVPIGRIFFDSSILPVQNNVGESRDAGGRVDTPARPLMLEIGGEHSAATLLKPLTLKKIGTGEMRGLTIVGPPEQYVAQEPFKSTLADNVAQLLEVAGEWPRLSTLRLMDVPLNERAMVALEKLNQLEALELSNTKIEIESLSKHDFLRNVSTLVLVNSQIEPLLKQIPPSNKLRSLIAEGDSIKPKSLAALSDCPYLFGLRLKTDTVTPQLVAALIQLKTVQSLTLEVRNVTLGEVKEIIDKSAGLGHLTIYQPDEKLKNLLKRLSSLRCGVDSW